MALNLLEAAKLHASNGDDRRAGLVMAFAAATPLLAAMPLATINGNAQSWTEEGALPTAAWRAVNGSYTAGEAKSKPRVEPLKIAGGLIQLDRALLQSMGEEQLAAQQAMKAKAISQLIGYGLIHGDASTNTSSVDGLASRFPIGGSRAVANTGSAALSMRSLDQAIDETSSPTHLLVNRATVRNIKSFLRNSTSITQTKDDYGRTVDQYNGLPFVIADPVDVDSSYQALPFTEGSSQCSIFVMSMGLDALHLIQGSRGLAIDDVGVNDTGILRGSLIEWMIGISDFGPRCVTRLTAITNATAIA
jgi:hypothetical protein